MKRKDNIKQGTPEWDQIRKGKITGTTLKAVMGTPKARQEAIYDLVAERLTKGNPDYEENPRDRGHRLEGEAVAAFEFETGKRVERTGFCEDDSNEFIAQSPDGLIGETAAVEIKCPFGKNHIKAWVKNEVPDEYYWQVVQYFVVNEKLELLYFVSYNPEIPIHPLHIIEVKKQDVFEHVRGARVAQEAFLGEVNKILKDIIEL